MCLNTQPKLEHGWERSDDGIHILSWFLGLDADRAPDGFAPLGGGYLIRSGVKTERDC